MLHRLGCALFVGREYERGERISREGLDAARAAGNSDDLGTAYANYADALNIVGRARRRTRRWSSRASAKSRVRSPDAPLADA